MILALVHILLAITAAAAAQTTQTTNTCSDGDDKSCTTVIASTSTVTLNTGYTLPRIGLGVYQSEPGEETYQACLAALEAGYRHIDTAAMYGNEQAVGRAVRDSGIPRSEIFVTTKFWPGYGAIEPGTGFDLAIAKGEESNTNLGLDYIDLYLIHAPAWGKERINVWRGFKELFKRGIARSIGVSNYGIHHLEEIIHTDIDSAEAANALGGEENIIPAVNQIELHPFMLHDDIESYCLSHGIVLQAYAPIAQATRLDHPLFVSLAEQHNCTCAQVMLRWGIQRRFVILPKSVQKHRIVENQNLDGFILSEMEMRQINALDEYKGTSWDPTIWE